MKNEALIALSVLFLILGIGFVFLFPMINDMLVGDQVETHTATVLTCTQEYRRSYLSNKRGETRYIFTVNATLEDGKEIKTVEDNSYQKRKFSQGEQITVYGLKNRYSLNRDDVFSPWGGNNNLMYLIVVAIASIPAIISKARK